MRLGGGGAVVGRRTTWHRSLAWCGCDLGDDRPRGRGGWTICWTSAAALIEIESESLEFKMDAYGFRWFRIGTRDQQTPP